MKLFHDLYYLIQLFDYYMFVQIQRNDISVSTTTFV